jgi:dephospho-CoA kinase
MATKPRRIGLTGGIACGKSTVAAHFQRLGVDIIDADVIARQLVAPGQEALAEIRAQFGEDYFLADGGLDRVKLRRLIFADAQARQQIEALLHPRIRAEMETQADQASGRYCILCVPLLIEAGFSVMVERILVVDCTLAQQHQRLAHRDRLSAAEIARVLHAQCARAERLHHADDVISNNSSPAAVQNAVVQLHKYYLMWASQGRRTKA